MCERPASSETPFPAADVASDAWTSGVSVAGATAASFGSPRVRQTSSSVARAYAPPRFPGIR
jgi:hypothetical protein